MNSIQIDWLPLGSIVMLEGEELPVMVFGRIQRNVETGEVFEYVGCQYPIGNVGKDQYIFFNSDMISHLVFLGYRDQAEMALSKKLSEIAAGHEPEDA